MMYQTLLDVEKEAERFLRIVKAAEIEHSSAPRSGSYLHIEGKLSGALRRSSMDLTRKLADLRQNR